MERKLGLCCPLVVAGGIAGGELCAPVPTCSQVTSLPRPQAGVCVWVVGGGYDGWEETSGGLEGDRSQA